MGREALDLFRQFQPRRRLNLTTIGRLMELHSVLGRLSTGLPVES